MTHADATPAVPPLPAAAHRGAAQSAVRAELARIAGRFEDADRRARAARAAAACGGQVPQSAAAAEAERDGAAAEFWAAGEDLAQLLLLLLRYAAKHQPQALTAALAEALKPELDGLADAIVKVEARR